MMATGITYLPPNGMTAAEARALNVAEGNLSEAQGAMSPAEIPEQLPEDEEDK